MTKLSAFQCTGQEVDTFWHLVRNVDSAQRGNAAQQVTEGSSICRVNELKVFQKRLAQGRQVGAFEKSIESIGRDLVRVQAIGFAVRHERELVAIRWEMNRRSSTQ